MPAAPGGRCAEKENDMNKSTEADYKAHEAAGFGRAAADRIEAQSPVLASSAPVRAEPPPEPPRQLNDGEKHAWRWGWENGYDAAQARSAEAIAVEED